RAPSLAPWSLVADARVNQRVDQIDEKVDEDENERSEHDEALDHRIVALADRLDKELADAVEIENLLGHHEPAHQERELEAEDGDHRQQRVFERVAREHGFFPQS